MTGACPSAPPQAAEPPALAAALAYAALGWRVFPVHHPAEEGRCSCGRRCSSPGKHPQTPGGFKDGSTVEKRVRGWWSSLYAPNLGIATGEVSGIVVLDVDPRHGGEESLAALQAGLPSLPPTLTVHTGGGGRHLYFRHPGAGQRVPCSTGKLGPGLDVRGDGGYVVAPPSIHGSGRAYAWAGDVLPSRDSPLAPVPDGLLALMLGRARGEKAKEPLPSVPPSGPSGTAAPGPVSGSPYGLKALESEVAALRSAPEGRRNDGLNRAAFALGQLVAGGELPRDLVEGRLLDAALEAGLPGDEARKTLRSGLEAGLREPRSAPGAGASSPGTAASPPGPQAPPPVATGDWPAPRPLPALEVDPPPLPGDLLPAALRPWMEDAAERTSLPLEFIAMPGLVALGSVVGRGCGIRPKRMDDWLVVPNLWGAIVAGPGRMKTAAASEGTRFLRRLATEATREHMARADTVRRTLEVLDAQRAGLKERAKRLARTRGDLSGLEEELADLDGRIEEVRHPERRFIISDSTVAKLGALLADNPRGLCLLRDEVAGLFLGMTRSGCEGDREFYLEAWNGTGSFVVDRIGRGTVHIPALTLSIFGSIQPGKLQAFIEEATGEGAGADGLLQRLQLLVWPGDLGPFVNVDRRPDALAREAAFEVFQRLAGDIPAPEKDEDTGIPFLRFAPEAQELFDAWRGGLETRLRAREMETTPAYAAHLAKYRSLVPALSLLFHLSEGAMAGESPGPVPLPSVQRAAALCDYLEIHARRVYAVELNRDLIAARELAVHIRAGHVPPGTTVRDIGKKGWTGLGTAAGLGAALRILEEHGWVRVVEGGGGPQGGRPARRVYGHPALGRRG